MPGEVLVDTNVVIGVFKGEQAVIHRVAIAEAIYVASVTIGELIFGALKSGNQASNLERVEEFLASSVVLSCDVNTARCYGGIKHGLRLRGRPIPDNDLWIAALAVQHGLTLMTLDRHFGEIEQLNVELCA